MLWRRNFLRPYSTGDSTKLTLSVLPKYHQNIFPMRGLNTLHHSYVTIEDAYCSIPRPHFGKSDHNTVFLLPAYKQKLKLEDPSQKEIQCWSEAAEACLQDCLGSVDLTVFKYSAENLDEYTITDFISKHVEDCVPKKSIRVFPNQKPWLNWEIHSLLKTNCAAFKSDSPDLGCHSIGLYTSLEYLDNKGTYVKLPLIDYSSTSNTIIPSRLISKLRDLVWYGNCSAQDRKKLQKIVRTAQTITEASLPSTDSIYTSRFFKSWLSIGTSCFISIYLKMDKWNLELQDTPMEVDTLTRLTDLGEHNLSE
eukprot:g46332.t1